MKYALVDGEKMEPSPELKGICPFCKSEMISKCGQVILWHWAHKGRKMCDPWWENETEWHRQWKNCFPSEWQEEVQIDDSTGEKHIADVRTKFGLVIEFQYSRIKAEERNSREKFYEGMIWVVYGARGNNEGCFRMTLTGPVETNPLTYHFTWWCNGRFFHSWSESKVKVYIDYGDDILWRLIRFDKTKNYGLVSPIDKSILIRDCIEGKEISMLAVSDSSDRKALTLPKELVRLGPEKNSEIEN